MDYVWLYGIIIIKNVGFEVRLIVIIPAPSFTATLGKSLNLSEPGSGASGVPEACGAGWTLLPSGGRQGVLLRC